MNYIQLWVALSSKDSQQPECCDKLYLIGLPVTGPKETRQDLSYIFSKSECNHCVNCTLQMFIKNPNQTFFTVSNQEEYVRNTMYIMCMTCLYYFRKENIGLN